VVSVSSLVCGQHYFASLRLTIKAVNSQI